MTDKVTVSVLLDPEVLEQVIELQKKYEIFSRSQFLRDCIDKGLKELKKK